MNVTGLPFLSLATLAACLVGAGTALLVGLLEAGAIGLTDVVGFGLLAALVLVGLAGIAVQAVTRELPS